MILPKKDSDTSSTPKLSKELVKNVQNSENVSIIKKSIMLYSILLIHFFFSIFFNLSFLRYTYAVY